MSSYCIADPAYPSTLPPCYENLWKSIYILFTIIYTLLLLYSVYHVFYTWKYKTNLVRIANILLFISIFCKLFLYIFFNFYN